MKVLLISESPLEKIGADYYAVDTWIQFPCRLSELCERLTLLAPVALRPLPGKPQPNSWKINLGRLAIVDHDYYHSYASYYRLWPSRVGQWERRLRELARSHDVVILRLPSPMIALVSKAVRAEGKPLVVMVAGDMQAQSDRILKSQGLKKLWYRALTHLLVRQEIRHSRDAALVCAYSRFLAHRHQGAKKVELMRTPHISLQDFVYREDTCQSQEIRLLRVSWLLPSKGLEPLLDAVAALVKKGRRIQLDIAGQEREPGYMDKLKKRVLDLRIGDRVHFLGWVPFDTLSELYQKSDIQVISSLAEGTPRCIIEGMARGLPLVSTAVGGCADTLNDEENALLVPPAESSALAGAVERLIADGGLRRRLIQNGYGMARSVSFENVGGKFIGKLQEVAASQ